MSTEPISEESEPDQVYYNVNISHDPKYGNKPSPMMYQIVRQTPWLINPKKYYLSVARIEFTTFQSFPIFVPTFLTGTNWSSNQTVYAFNLSYGGIDSGPFYVTYQTSQTNTSPNTGFVTADNNYPTSNPYYWVYDFETICAGFNTALTLAFNHLKTIAPVPGPANPPTIYFDNQLQRLGLRVQHAYYETGPGLTPILIYFNNQLANFFNGFPYVGVADNALDAKDNYFIVRHLFNNIDPYDNKYVDVVPFNYCGSYLSPVQTVQLITDLPISNQEYTPPITSTTSQGLNSNPNQFNPTSAILTDFIPDFSQISNINAAEIYNKVDNFRYYEFGTNSPLQNFYLSIQFTDRNGNVIPMFIPAGVTASVKLVCVKKSIVNTYGRNILHHIK